VIPAFPPPSSFSGKALAPILRLPMPYPEVTIDLHLSDLFSETALTFSSITPLLVFVFFSRGLPLSSQADVSKLSS